MTSHCVVTPGLTACHCLYYFVNKSIICTNRLLFPISLACLEYSLVCCEQIIELVLTCLHHLHVQWMYMYSNISCCFLPIADREGAVSACSNSSGRSISPVPPSHAHTNHISGESSAMYSACVCVCVCLHICVHVC